jgi:hypothetical protein
MNTNAIQTFDRNWNKGLGHLTVFSSGVEGVPTLGYLQDLAKTVNATVNHLGYGCFAAEAGLAGEVFSFLAGGSMTREEDFSHAPLTPRRNHRAWMLGCLRKDFPHLNLGEIDPQVADFWADKV